MVIDGIYCTNSCPFPKFKNKANICVLLDSLATIALYGKTPNDFNNNYSLLAENLEADAL